MAVDMTIWRQLVIDAVATVADEAFQRRAWFGNGKEVSSPTEEYCQLLGDSEFEEYLSRSDNCLTKQQIQTGKDLAKAMMDLKPFVFKTTWTMKPAELIDDPRWNDIRKIAAEFLKSIS